MAYVRRALFGVLLLYASWVGMMLTHECGHVLHAWLSGGKIAHVSLPLAGFSRTDVAPNPHPQFVAWGGAVWGCFTPLLLLAAACRFARPRRLLLFFAGFCLIANGAYLAVGLPLRAGDAGDLVRHGAPPWTLVAFGVITVPLGLAFWHLLGPRFGLLRPPNTRIDPSPKENRN